MFLSKRICEMWIILIPFLGIFGMAYALGIESVGPTCRRPFISDCQDVKDLDFSKSDVYHVTPPGTYTGYDVYCDMDTDDGGWLVIQRREDGSVDFYRDWNDYQSGFGNVSGEHWLGNLPLYIISLGGYYELRVDMEDWEGNILYAKYTIFSIGGPEEKYRVVIGGYTGNAGDCLSSMNGMKFSTRDQDNDIKAEFNCAEKFTGGWWYNRCHCACLNGKYLWVWLANRC